MTYIINPFITLAMHTYLQSYGIKDQQAHEY